MSQFPGACSQSLQISSSFKSTLIIRKGQSSTHTKIRNEMNSTELQKKVKSLTCRVPEARRFHESKSRMGTFSECCGSPSSCHRINWELLKHRLPGSSLEGQDLRTDIPIKFSEDADAVCSGDLLDIHWPRAMRTERQTLWALGSTIHGPNNQLQGGSHSCYT